MAVYLLNISIDTADPDPNVIPNYGDLNPQESFAEILLEKVLGFEDAIAEYDDHENEDHNCKRQLRFELLYLSQLVINMPVVVMSKGEQFFRDYILDLPPGFPGSDSPPPEA